MRNISLNEVIKNRKTVYPKEFTGNEIPYETVTDILESALYAPTHRRTEPWFFRVYRNESKEKLCELINKIDDKKYPKIKLNKFIDKVNLSDTVVAVFMKRDKKESVPEWEEIAAVAMSVQNMWLTSYVNNVGSYWSTPSFKDEYAKLLNIDKNEKSLGFFFMGSYKHKIINKVREGIEMKVKWV